MMRIILAAAVIIMAFALRPAQAYEAPWCAVMNMGFGDMHWSCYYHSLEECVPHVIAGNRGFCNPNPAYVGPLKPEHKHSARRHTRKRHD